MFVRVKVLAVYNTGSFFYLNKALYFESIDHKQDRQCTYQVTPRRVLSTIVPEEKQLVLWYYVF
jgi:hypothetical protein